MHRGVFDKEKTKKKTPKKIQHGTYYIIIINAILKSTMLVQ